MRPIPTPEITVTVIGVGRVGSAVAFALIPHCSRLYLMDKDKKRLEGEFRDLRHAAWLINKNCRIEKGTLKDANSSDYAIICAGKARKSSKESTEDLFDYNYPIVKSICRKLRVRALILTNPTERIAEKINREVFKMPLAIPIGGMLDKARAQIDGIAGGYIIDRKGHTNWGVAGEVVRFVTSGKISECAGLWSWMKTSEIDSIERSIEKRRRLSTLAKKEKLAMR